MTLLRNKILLLLICLVILIVNVLTDHFYAPNGIYFTPIVILITTSLVLFIDQEIDILLKAFLIYFFIALNDIGIKLYGGGIHDLKDKRLY